MLGLSTLTMGRASARAVSVTWVTLAGDAHDGVCDLIGLAVKLGGPHRLSPVLLSAYLLTEYRSTGLPSTGFAGPDVPGTLEADLAVIAHPGKLGNQCATGDAVEDRLQVGKRGRGLEPQLLAQVLAQRAGVVLPVDHVKLGGHLLQDVL